MSRDQNAEKMKLGSESFERAEQIKYLGTVLTNKTLIHEEIKNRLKLGIFAIISCRIFCLKILCPKIQRIRYA
jgi:hypothetical protein